MKNLITLLLFTLLGCSATHEIYGNFDYKFSRSGGTIPVYENLVINGHKVHYRFIKQNHKIKRDFLLTTSDIENIEKVLSENNFRLIEENYKKLYDNTTTEITVKNGPNSGHKSDASLIMDKDQARWESVVQVFQNIIDSKE